MKKNKITFLILFFLLTAAVIPVWFMLPVSRENMENKADALFPSVSETGWRDWPKSVDAWFTDNLPFKGQMIRLYRGLQDLTGADYEHSDVIRGKEGWLFYRKTVENYKGLTRFSDEELASIETTLSRFSKSLAKSGTRFLFYIAPDKEQIYDRFMPDEIRRTSAISRGDQVLEYLTDNVDFPVIYPKELLREVADELPIYFNTDSHWNDLGGYIAAQQVRASFADEPPAMPDLSRMEYTIRNSKGKDLANMIGLTGRLKEQRYVELTWKDDVQVQKTGTYEHGLLQRYISDANDKKLLLIGDSFSEYYMRSALHDVGEVQFVTYGNLNLIDMQVFDPDYVVIMLVERNLPFLLSGIY